MIEKLKTTRGGWTYEKITFPKGYTPSSVKWRYKDGLFQTYIERRLRDDEDLSKFFEVEEAEIKTIRGHRVLTGWVLMEKSAYLYDLDLST